jgi:hypothetical protein
LQKIEKVLDGDNENVCSRAACWMWKLKSIWKNFLDNKSKVNSQKSKVKSQKSKVKSQKSKVKSQKSKVQCFVKVWNYGSGVGWGSQETHELCFDKVKKKFINNKTSPKILLSYYLLIILNALFSFPKLFWLVTNKVL